MNLVKIDKICKELLVSPLVNILVFSKPFTKFHKILENLKVHVFKRQAIKSPKDKSIEKMKQNMKVFPNHENKLQTKPKNIHQNY